MPIESGPTRERIIRTTIPLIMVGVFSIWFAYDGMVGYPERNLAENLGQLPSEERARAKNVPVYPTITEEYLTKELESKIRTALKATGLEAKRKGLEAAMGCVPSWESNGVWYYFGPAYRIRIPSSPTEEISKQRTEKSETDIVWQKRISLVLAVLGVVLLIQLIRVVRTHLVVDDSGIKFGGRGPIAWEAIKNLLTESFDRHGWVDLTYDHEGRECRLRLDEYHLAKFDKIIDEICQRKGLTNPLPVRGEAKAP